MEEIKKETIQKTEWNGFTKDELIQEAETLEGCGGYLHMKLYGYTSKRLREEAENLKDQKK